jgi:hypothetical protein
MDKDRIVTIFTLFLEKIKKNKRNPETWTSGQI